MGSTIDPRLWQMIRQGSQRFGLDPRAAAAVSLMEGGGRFGEVGDHNTSFGPWQMHQGGALGAHNAAWANSRAGVMGALHMMAADGARGLSGRAAVNAIVSRFERPAAPGPEIAGAISRYGSIAPGMAQGGFTPAGGAPRGGGGQGGGQGQRQQLLAALSSSLGQFAATGQVGSVSDQLAQQSAQLPSRGAFGAAQPGQSGGPMSKTAQTAIQFAKGAIGTPYVWGGESAKGYDCSGLIQAAFKQAGIDPGRTTYDQIKHGSAVHWGQFRPGDLIFSDFEGTGKPTHVVMYIGHGQVVAAPHTGTKVQTENVNLFRNNFIGARRYF